MILCENVTESYVTILKPWLLLHMRQINYNIVLYYTWCFDALDAEENNYNSHSLFVTQPIFLYICIYYVINMYFQIMTFTETFMAWTLLPVFLRLGRISCIYHCVWLRSGSDAVLSWILSELGAVVLPN